jgi:hypothetical protein
MQKMHEPPPELAGTVHRAKPGMSDKEINQIVGGVFALLAVTAAQSVADFNKLPPEEQQKIRDREGKRMLQSQLDWQQHQIDVNNCKYIYRENCMMQ